MQEIDIISDATILNTELGIGAAIVRLDDNIKESLKTGHNSHKYQIIKGLWIFKAENSIEAEILAGLHALLEFKKTKERGLDKIKINWFCDLPYLGDLIEKPSTCKNSALKNALLKFNSEILNHDLKPNHIFSSQIKIYHEGCHRVCGALRKKVLVTPSKDHLSVINLFFKANKNWTFYSTL